MGFNQKALDELFGVHRNEEGDVVKNAPKETSQGGLHNNQAESPKKSSKLFNGDELKELPINLLQDFSTGAEKQPFRAYTPEQLESLRQDIIQNGVIQPLIVRPIDDERYEIISGHNRRTAAREAGYIVVPCIVRTMTDEEAILQMVSTNLQQRKNLLPSEKAFAYRMQLSAMKQQGARTDLTCDQNGQKLAGKKSVEIMAEKAQDSRNQIQRYVRLTYLIPRLLNAVDQQKIGLTIGATLSFLSPKSQEAVEIYCFEQHSIYISQELANRMREAEQAGERITEQLLEQLIRCVGKDLRSISIPMKKVQKYFPEGATQKEIIKTVQQALKLYFEQK